MKPIHIVSITATITFLVTHLFAAPFIVGATEGSKWVGCQIQQLSGKAGASVYKFFHSNSDHELITASDKEDSDFD